MSIGATRQTEPVLGVLFILQTVSVVMRPNEPPSIARQNAQLRQQVKLSRCVHPEQSIIIRLLHDDGYIEYCSDCDKVLSIYEPR